MSYAFFASQYNQNNQYYLQPPQISYISLLIHILNTTYVCYTLLLRQLHQQSYQQMSHQLPQRYLQRYLQLKFLIAVVDAIAPVIGVKQVSPSNHSQRDKRFWFESDLRIVI